VSRPACGVARRHHVLHVRTRSPLLLALFLSVPGLASADSAGWRFPAENLDPAVQPSRDFYEFAVGGWRAAHPVPPQYARWGVFDVLAAETRAKVHAILEDAASSAEPGDETRRKVGDFFASGMDEAAADAAGASPLAPELARIDRIADADDLEAEIAHLQEIGIGAGFDFGKMPDPVQSTLIIGVADQGGLGLPDPSYYLSKDPRIAALRDAYAQHAAALLQLAGEAPADAGRDAAAALRMETALAAASQTRVERRDPYATYHSMDLAALAALTPHLSWPKYFALLGRPDIERINVTAPAFFGEVDRLVAHAAPSDWRAYLRLRLVDTAAPYLSRDFVDEHFRFEARLTGVEEQRPRWERVLRAEDRALGFAVGKLFVERWFPPEAKTRAVTLLDDVRAALRTDLATLPWMGPETRQRAIEKLDLMANRIGYPEVWRDYTGLAVDRGPWVDNVFRAAAFEMRRELSEIGRPTDRGAWEMTPQTVNAYYDPSLNVIVFPAGILQAPFFDPSAPEAWNHGAIGAVMGHEITHGFDDEGSQYDKVGNLENWWTEEDRKLFEAKTRKVSAQYSGYTAVDSLKVNGDLTLGENIADIGGLTIAYHAWQISLKGKPAPVIDGFTGEQRFFLGHAQGWRRKLRPELIRTVVLSDPHSPSEWRVNGPLSDMPEFAEAFHCKAGDAMVRSEQDRPAIW